jgi:predicted amidohydrolase
MELKVGFAQFSPVRGEVERNIAHLRALLTGVQADVLVLPELSNSGYLHASAEALRPFSEPRDGSGPFLSAMRELAQEIGGLIVAGFAEQAPEGIYNSAAAVDREGVRQVYRKAHLFMDEQDLFLPGNSGFHTLEYRGVQIGMLICFDWAFPEAARTLMLKGAQILAHPSDLVLPYAQKAMVTRSLENCVFSITANRWGSETLDQRTLSFSGLSQVVDVKGEVLVQAPANADHVQVCEIDPQLAENKQITARNHLVNDRRPDLYEL